MAPGEQGVDDQGGAGRLLLVPLLPRLLNPNAVRRTIADGVNQKLIAYAGKVGGTITTRSSSSPRPASTSRTSRSPTRCRPAEGRGRQAAEGAAPPDPLGSPARRRHGQARRRRPPSPRRGTTSTGENWRPGISTGRRPGARSTRKDVSSRTRRGPTGPRQGGVVEGVAEVRVVADEGGGGGRGRR